MRILWLAFLHTVLTAAQGYGGPWLDVSSLQAPSFQRPVDVVTDVINELGVRILQEYGDSRNSGNVAFSPTGIGFVLAALYEGSAGPGNEQIAHVLGLPRDKDVTRIGLRDIHRRLRSYLSPDGFLGGLTLNREHTKLRPEYEDVLKFLGFDLPSGDDGANATDSSTSLPEATTTPSGPASGSSSPASTETTESPTTLTPSTQEPTSTVAGTTVTSRIGEDVTATVQATEEAAETSTRTPKEVTTTTANPEETTTLKSDAEAVVTMSTRETSGHTTTSRVAEVTEELSSTVEITAVPSTTVSSTTPVPATTESPTTVSEVSSRLTEATTEIPPVGESTVPLSSTEPTTVATVVTEGQEVRETTLTSAKEVADATKPGTTTLKTEDAVSAETTTSMATGLSSATESGTTVSSEGEEANVEVLDMSDGESEVGNSSSNPEESGEELMTTSTEESSTLEPEETSSNEIVYESTTVSMETTTVDQVDEVETIANLNATSSESGNLLSIENKNANAETKSNSSAVGTEPRERRRVGIRDPVVRTLLDARSAKPEIQVTAKSELAKSEESGVVWISKADDSTTLHTILQKDRDDENGDSAKSSTREKAVVKGGARKRGTRSPRGYFSNFPDFPSFPVYPAFPGFPEESSWTRGVGGWRVHSPKTDEGFGDSSELSFLVNGEDATVVSAATYTVVLPFAFLPTLQALALEFPLDDPRYNILLLLPTDRDGTRRLAKDLTNVGLRELRKELQPAWVRAMIPSFMLKGFVTLTPFLQRLGIRDVFEPRDADLSPMTEDVGVYARDVQQSIAVNIRNYMKPDRTHSRNGLFERAGPVSFVAEHPFLFFIIDAETGVALIAGRIEDPLNSRIL